MIQVGKGLSQDAKAQKLAFQHWIEAVNISFTSLLSGFFFFCCFLSFKVLD